MTEIPEKPSTPQPSGDPPNAHADASFRPINTAYGAVFRPNRLSLGLVVPIENYASSSVPTLERHLERVQLAEDPATPPQPIHLGFRSGVDHLLPYLDSLSQIGIHHVALNLRFNRADIETTLRLAADVLPAFTD